MSRTTENLVKLAHTLAEHESVTHWAISMRLLKRGDFFEKLAKGREPRVDTCERVLDLIAAAWPEDLEWPRGIERPRSAKQNAGRVA